MNIEISSEELKKCKLFVATPCYGGNCNASYARSMIELGILCQQYGINFFVYYLSNESLVQRARNYCADEFMRSDCTHLMFIDSDIGFDAKNVIDLLGLSLYNKTDYNIIGAPYPKKCLSASTKVYTEDGVMTISKLVNTRYTGKVQSLDATNKVSWKHVTNHWSEKNLTGKKWVSISTAKKSETSWTASKGKIICTDDHEIAYIQNPLDPVVMYTKAEDMKEKYLVQTTKPSINNKDSSVRSPLLNREQVSVLVGIALGDGYLNDRFITVHSENQIEYTKYIQSILGGRIHISKNNVNDMTLKNGQTQYLSNLVSRGKSKTLKNVINYIDEISLAFLYMDDGNRYFYPEVPPTEFSDKTWWVNEITSETRRSESPPGGDWKLGRKTLDKYRKPTSSIATMSFSIEDNQLLSNHIKNKFGIDSEIRFQKGKTENLPYLHFDAINTDKLHSLIHPYIHKSMEYKLNEEYRNTDKHQFNTQPLEISATLVTEVNSIESDSYLYDIEVEDNHNFFINDGVLVHNCIAWDKIKLAVDKGFADKDPSVLEKFVGDYVINIGKEKIQFKSDEPLEVMEIGTGFMMIPRDTLVRYQEAYPEYSYKPDHVRSENFDGKREITAFFDCTIDRNYKFKDIKNIVSRLAAGEEVSASEAQDLLNKESTASKRYLSEDYNFCQYSRDIGLRVWLAPWMQLNHTGTMVFGGSLLDVLSIGASPTA